MAPKATTTRKPPSWAVDRWAEPVREEEAAEPEAEESATPAGLTALEADPEAAAEFG